MTDLSSPLFIDAVIGCVAEGRDPTVQELFHVAQRIWSDGAPDRSAFAWGRLPTASLDRLSALRSARLALCGSW